MKYLLDFSEIINLKSWYEDASRKLNFPAYYGQNFDAFWDCLLDMDSGTEISIKGLTELRKKLPDAYNKLIKCIDDYQGEYSDIQFQLFLLA